MITLIKVIAWFISFTAGWYLCRRFGLVTYLALTAFIASFSVITSLNRSNK